MDVILTSVGVGAVAGGIAGFVWGGVGGRIAMRILFLTSDDRVRGLTSDDGFEIGVVTAATVVLLILTTVMGTIAGTAFGFLRTGLTGPDWLITLGITVAAAAAGGALVVQDEGIDFRVLEPLWLAVGLFVLIPALWGVSVERIARRVESFRSVFPAPLARTERGYWGVPGGVAAWLALAAITALGVVDLVTEVSNLA